MSIPGPEHPNDSYNIEGVTEPIIKVHTAQQVIANVQEYSCQEDRRFPRHFHYHFEMGIMLRGRSNVYYEGHTVDLRPGDVWLCDRWEPHSFTVEEYPFLSISFIIAPDFFSRLNAGNPVRPMRWDAPFLVMPNKRPGTPGRRRRAIENIGIDLVRMIDADDPMVEHWAQVKVMELLLHLRSDWRDQGSGAVHAASSQEARVLNNAIELVVRRKSFITVKEAAAACSMTAKKFSRLFKKYMGVTFPRFSYQYRLKGAASQLIETEDPIKAIAYDWGFSDTSHLDHAFIECYGCSPLEYREQQLVLSADDSP